MVAHGRRKLVACAFNGHSQMSSRYPYLSFCVWLREYEQCQKCSSVHKKLQHFPAFFGGFRVLGFSFIFEVSRSAHFFLGMSDSMKAQMASALHLHEAQAS